MNDLNWIGKAILAAAFAISFFATQAVMGIANAGTISQVPQAVHTCRVYMSDSTPLVYPYTTNAVINPTADWGARSITMRKVSFLMTPHRYMGKKVCIVDTRISGAPLLVCEAVLGHGRKETLRAVSDAAWFFPLNF